MISSDILAFNSVFYRNCRLQIEHFSYCSFKVIMCIVKENYQGRSWRHALNTFVLITFLLNNEWRASSAEELKTIQFGNNISLTCLSNNSNLTWLRKNSNISLQSERFTKDKTMKIVDGNTIYKHTLNIINVQLSDEDLYLCTSTDTNSSVCNYYIQPIISPSIILSSNETLKRKIGQAVTFFCLVEAFPLNESFKSQIVWLKDGIRVPLLNDLTNITQLNKTHLNVTLELTEIYKKENGTYTCFVPSARENEIMKKEITLLVLDVPQVSIDYAKAVGKSKIFLNWTVNDGNDGVQKYFVQFMPDGAPTFTYYNHAIGGKNTSYLLENFLPNTSYLLRMSAKNSVGDGAHHQYHQPVRTLQKDPIFIPNVETTGSTPSTITIGWSPPSPELLEYIQYYELVVTETGENPKIIEEAIYQQNSRNLPYMFDNLKTATVYEFKVRSCSDITKLCGPWSDIVNGTTMDGVASKPTELKVVCLARNETRLNSVIITWNLPATPNGKVVSYLIHLGGKSTYKVDGRLHDEVWGPKIRRVDEPHHKTVYEGVNSNTNYTVAVSAITRHRKSGESVIGSCVMPISVPETINRIMWTKIKTSNNKCVFKIFLPKISERNGPICCYRIYLVRMKDYKKELPHPQDLNISTYREVHSGNSQGGAYIAEMFSGNNVKSEIFLGDGKRFLDPYYNKLDSTDSSCMKCLDGVPFLRKNTAQINKDLILTSTEIPQQQSRVYTSAPELFQRDKKNKSGSSEETVSKMIDSRSRRRRIPKVIDVQNSFQYLTNNFSDETNRNEINESVEKLVQYDDVFDGEIDINSNYTGFVEIIVRDKNKILTAYSSYFEVITPRTTAEYFDKVNDVSVILNIVIQALGVLIGIVLLLIITLCFLHHYNSKRSELGEEISLRDSLSRALCGGRSGNHRQFIGTATVKSSDIGPINKSDLAQVYKNLHKDTDYGFLREYEMLPSRFNDRTTKNSDMKENAIKNRYPDIKAYDQTRVKLSQINNIQCTDYINANFVIGYKERKKFICAQGPMECTVNDFWRMIWEQHLEIIVMLTNLEEYNKAKCAKYWPEKVCDSKHYGDIVVKFSSEQRFGDFLIRNLEVFRRNLLNELDEERRQITQYHYLVWKDFMAPEHPHGIIKFIRAINAVYSVQRGPILVHCSAGVGRTGTFVALDTLLQELEEEDKVSIFNTVYDLRHQRNFLVQSLKQYIFLYRALLDCAVFGNTELSALFLTVAIEAMKIKLIDMKDKCKLEIEFEKLQSVTDETNKSCLFGSNEENVCKNRSNTVVPFDRNRVILSPIPMRENSTYINASFIEGYDISEHFIITQDPLENTISDFWRMISEQSISTVVMLSEIGEGSRKCSRYWADDEIMYEHILVKYIHSESCPYYIRREFNVTNAKIDDTIQVTQFQYNGWPTVDGEVPEVCRGIIELVDQAQNHHSKANKSISNAPMLVHCSLGTDRSSIFVAMCILVQQLRTEKKIDICTTVRKLRSQRTSLLDTYAQYEFLHRAIANYADLHNLSNEFSDEK